MMAKLAITLPNTHDAKLMLHELNQMLPAISMLHIPHPLPL